MIEVRPKGCINELNFVYTAKMEGYTNTSSDIPKLDEIVVLKQVIVFLENGTKPCLKFVSRPF